MNERRNWTKIAAVMVMLGAVGILVKTDVYWQLGEWVPIRGGGVPPWQACAGAAVLAAIGFYLWVLSKKQH